MIASIALQKGIFQALQGDTPVYEVVPPKSLMPYIQIGNMTKMDSPTKTNRERYLFQILIHWWTEGSSSLKGKEL